MNTNNKDKKTKDKKTFPAQALLMVSASLILVLSLGGLIACSSATPSNDSSINANDTSANEQKSATVAEGSVAPDFSFTTIDGQTKKLSDYEGQVVLLNFWATWCGYCIDEMPSMQKLTDDYPDVAVVAINRGDSPTEATSFAAENAYDFVWGLDENGAIEKLYPANGIPYSVVIDKEGTIIAIFEGSAPDMYPYFESAVIEAGA